MYSKVSNPTVEIFNYDTNEYLATARFILTRETENALLQLVNHGITPPAMILQNVEIVRAAENYVPPAPYQKIRRKAIMRAIFTDALSDRHVPIELRYSHDLIIRSPLYNNIYRSVEVSDIQVNDIIPLE